MFRQYDIVTTTKSIVVPAGTLRRGSQGTIVEIFEIGRKTGYHTEFLDARGATKALVILTADQIEPAQKARSGE